MAVTDRTLPPHSHPNYRLWANYAAFSRFRGDLVADIIASGGDAEGKAILDLGCGAGGTSLALAERGADVLALDLSEARVEKLKEKAKGGHLKLRIDVGDALRIPAANQSFDWVILQDVIEHLPEPQEALAEVSRVLRPEGRIYLSTPNRWSPFNFFSDPHWNLPLVSTLPRAAVIFFITKIIRREKEFRPDFAALFSLRRLRTMFENAGFGFDFVNRDVARRLFANPKSVVNSEFHLYIVASMRRMKLDKIAIRLVNDDWGAFNYFWNPTWYLVARRNPKTLVIQDVLQQKVA
jgi:SAM-dependent methyltransferase